MQLLSSLLCALLVATAAASPGPTQENGIANPQVVQARDALPGGWFGSSSKNDDDEEKKKQAAADKQQADGEKNPKFVKLMDHGGDDSDDEDNNKPLDWSGTTK